MIEMLPACAHSTSILWTLEAVGPASAHRFDLTTGSVCLAIWLYLLLAHGRFWMVQRLGAHRSPPAKVSGPIAVVIPARNEADVVGKSVSSLLRQNCAASLHIFVIDDN